MKNFSEQLDIFIKNTLQTHNTSPLLADWSEVEALLKNEHKPIAFKLTHKVIMLYAGIIVVIVTSFGIVKWVQYYSSRSSKTEETTVNTTFTILSASDTKEVMSNSVTTLNIKEDTSLAKIDAAAFTKTEQKTDSLRNYFNKKQTEEEKIKAGVKQKEKAIPQQEPRQTDSLTPIPGTGDIYDNTLLPKDTIKKVWHQKEAKTDTSSAIDSSQGFFQSTEKE